MFWLLSIINECDNVTQIIHQSDFISADSRAGFIIEEFPPLKVLTLYTVPREKKKFKDIKIFYLNKDLT